MKEEAIKNIDDIIKDYRTREYYEDYRRIRSGKKYDKNFEDYKKYHIINMIKHFESINEYDKSSYLNLRLNGFD